MEYFKRHTDLQETFYKGGLRDEVELEIDPFNRLGSYNRVGQLIRPMKPRNICESSESSFQQSVIVWQRCIRWDRLAVLPGSYCQVGRVMVEWSTIILGSKRISRYPDELRLFHTQGNGQVSSVHPIRSICLMDPICLLTSLCSSRDGNTAAASCSLTSFK